MYARDFKSTVGRHHEGFRGTTQHDTQEFLITLLDSLHEDLNIWQKKPYIKNPEYDAVNDPTI